MVQTKPGCCVVRSLKSPRRRWVAVCGPTASGKSSLGMRLARDLQGEIISCDSVQVYRGFDIGSAKPTQADQLEVRHHLIDVVGWRENFDTGIYGNLAIQARTDILDRGKVPILVGGSGLYLRAVLGDQSGQRWHGDLPRDEELRKKLNALPSEDLFAKLTACDPVRASQLHPNDRYRVIRALELFQLLGRPLAEVPVSTPEPSAVREESADVFMIILDPPRAALHQAIAVRSEQMLTNGLIAEVQRLLAEGCPVTGCKPMESIGYKEVAHFLTGELKREELWEKINASSRQYAKRQVTWFKSVNATLRLSAEPGSISSEEYRKLLHTLQMFLSES